MNFQKIVFFIPLFSQL